MDQHLLDQCVTALVNQSHQPNATYTNRPHHNMAACYEEAGNVMLLVLLAEMIDQALQYPDIDMLCLEYNVYRNGNEKETVVVGSVVCDGIQETFFQNGYYLDDIEFLENPAARQTREDLSVLCQLMEQVGISEFLTNQSFYNSRYTKDNTAMAFFQKNFASEWAIIENTLISHNIDQTNKSSSHKSKM